MSEIQLKATNVENKPVRIGDLPIIKTNILENAGQMDKGVVGGYNGAFPLTAASEGGIYLLPSTGKFYVCETAYNGAQISAPNSNFVELSVWKNHDRLNNLIIFESIENWKIKKIYNSRYYEAWKTTTVKSKEIIEIPIPSIVDLEHADNVITISAWNNGNNVFNLSQGNNPKKNFSIYFDNDSLSRAICIQIKIKYR